MTFFNTKNITVGILALAGIFLIIGSIVIPLVGATEVGGSARFICPLH